MSSSANFHHLPRADLSTQICAAYFLTFFLTNTEYQAGPRD